MKFEINVTSELLIRLAYKMHTDVNDWQERWSNNQFHRNRVLNKARQIGSSWYFSLEALNDACLTGRNKIFIGDALLIQNEIQYLCHHANQMKHEDFMDYFKENDRLIIKLNNGAKIYFITTKFPVVADITGDVYVPEWSWNENPAEILALAKGIANHTKWRRTFYSTRSKLDKASQLNIGACNSENVFIDRVNLFQATLDHVTCYDDIQKGSERFHPEAFGEMYLCAFSGG
ncbi:terminase large subunit domain-containing protein [Providencia rettgeri]|uniref:terminase large subunit domain-containing protein n=1 Tax=Providencia rettgeri TaxID=587 RepID=UPI0032D9E7C7